MHTSKQTRLLSLTMALLLLVSLFGITAEAAGELPVPTRNRSLQNYDRWANIIDSYLYQDIDGSLVRVENLNDYESDQIIIERYTGNVTGQKELIESHTLSFELPVFGGFYCGKDYNFLVFGDRNLHDSDQQEVIRVVKYSRDWQRLGETSIRGANIHTPFNNGTLRCTEYNGMLYILTCRTMYTNSAGVNHQSNLLLAIRESDMTLTDSSFRNLANRIYGFVSHSLTQFLAVDRNGRLVSMNQGDANPRSAVIYQFPGLAGSEVVTGDNGTSGDVLVFPEQEDYRDTGVSIGGFCASETSYLTAFAQDFYGNSRNIYVYATDLDQLSNTTSVKLTDYSGNNYASTPYLIRLNADLFIVLWEEMNNSAHFASNNTYFYVLLNGEGKPVSEIRSLPGNLSDCQPILTGDKCITWYVTGAGNSRKTTPIFYTLDADTGIVSRQFTDSESCTFSDVKSGHWSAPFVEMAAANGWVNGTGNGQFSPDKTLNFAEFGTLMVRYLFPADAGPLANQSASPWHAPYMNLATSKGLWAGTAIQSNPGAAEEPINRYNMSQVIYNILKAEGALPSAQMISQAKAAIPDFAAVPAEFQEAVAACYAAKLLNGMDQAGTFGGEGIMNRAQSAKVISLISDLMNSNK